MHRRHPGSAPRRLALASLLLLAACVPPEGSAPAGPGGASSSGATSSSGGSTGGGSTGGGSTGGGSTGGGSTGGGSSGGSSGGAFTVSAGPIPVAGAVRTADGAAPGGHSVALTSVGHGAEYRDLPAADILSIQYASVSVGTLTVSVNGQVVRKLNVHSSGALTGSFLVARIGVAIPSRATVTIGRAAGDVAVNVAQLVVGSGDLRLPPDIWNLPPLTVASGPYPADWKGLGLTYVVPEWWREAKLGAWAHWDPQSMPEQGDWYARKMYQEGDPAYAYHVRTFGHPSEYGYKDVARNWAIDRWRPEELMDLYVEMGARFFVAMGVHHDNFDCWDSTYQPWNSVRVGPKVDIVGTWERSARQRGLPFGIGFHNTPARTWGQFMPVRYTGDSRGAKKGVPYDALQTVLDGRGKWWEGLDPADLYGPAHTAADPLHSPFANQFMWRVDDAVARYRPDVIYFDEHAGDSQLDLGVRMGLGQLAPSLVANYYNRSLAWTGGRMGVVVNLKGVGGAYDSFQNAPELLPYVERALVRSTEALIEGRISAYPFQTETSIADWHYRSGQAYTGAGALVEALMQNVSRNGSMLLNLTQHGRGDLDPEVVRIAKDVGAWLKVNGEAVYGSRPFEVQGDASVAYTRNHGNVYATLLAWNGGPITLPALRGGGATLGRISRVELLGSDVTLAFVQDGRGLTVTPSRAPAALAGIGDQRLASGVRVLRITHDRGWTNDDDPGSAAPGWLRRASLGSGDYNDDLTTSDTPGAAWSAAFTGSAVAVYAPRERGAGTIEIQIDGTTVATADLSTAGPRLAQQLVAQVTGLAPGKHTIRVIHRGTGAVAVDAIRPS